MKNFLSMVFFIMATNVYAGMPVEIGDITFLQVHNNPDSTLSSGQRFIVKLSSSASENSCGYDQWTGYLDSDVGRAQYSALLSAVMASKQIKLEGTAPDRCESGSLLLRNVYAVW